MRIGKPRPLRGSAEVMAGMGRVRNRMDTQALVRALLRASLAKLLADCMLAAVAAAKPLEISFRLAVPGVEVTAPINPMVQK